MSTDPVRIYNAAEVSAHLGVTPAAVTNWRRRHADAPAPDYVTGDGREYWADLAPWRAWHTERTARRLDRAAERAERARVRAAERAALARGRAEVAAIVAERAEAAEELAKAYRAGTV